MRWSTLHRAAALGMGFAVFAAASVADAQAPPPPYPPPPPAYAPAPPLPASPEASEIAACLCLWQEMDAASADLSANQRAYQAVQDELGRLDSQLQSARAGVDVNNPQSVGQFRQLLEQRDTVFQRDRGTALTALSGATERYNARANEYNARCANRPRDPALLARVQATLSCPPPR
jgi:hypothetical protein